MQCNIDKNSVRCEMKQKRKQLNNSEILSKSRAVCMAFTAIEGFLKAQTVCVYMNAFNEVETGDIINECKRLGKRIVVPIVDGDDIYLSEFDDELKKGAFGIPEPECIKKFPKEKVDIFAVPGLAYDKKGGRVGFGKGYYDKLLKNTKAIKIGLAYEFQTMDCLPTDEHDILMNYVINEREVISCAN